MSGVSLLRLPWREPRDQEVVVEREDQAAAQGGHHAEAHRVRVGDALVGELLQPGPCRPVMLRIA